MREKRTMYDARYALTNGTINKVIVEGSEFKNKDLVIVKGECVFSKVGSDVFFTEEEARSNLYFKFFSSLFKSPHAVSFFYLSISLYKAIYICNLCIFLHQANSHRNYRIGYILQENQNRVSFARPDNFLKYLLHFL